MVYTCIIVPKTGFSIHLGVTKRLIISLTGHADVKLGRNVARTFLDYYNLRHLEQEPRYSSDHTPP